MTVTSVRVSNFRVFFFGANILLLLHRKNRLISFCVSICHANLGPVVRN